MATNEQGIRGNAAMMVGLGIGVLWILMALTALWSALRGFQNDRSDWALGWGLVGVFLFAAGAAAILATRHHQRRLREHH